MAKTTNLWGGRFTGKPDKTFVEFNNSFGFDRRLFAADVRASLAYAEALTNAGVLTKRENSRIKNGLKTLLKQAQFDNGFFDGSDAEDVHSFIESKLVILVGDAGKKLHTGRSRNDQVATAFRLWLREAIDGIITDLTDLQRSLVDAAARHDSAVLPGYTHMQRAQPVLWAHWCLAYFEMTKRDRERLDQVRRQTNVMPLGSGALAGTSFPIDRAAIAAELEFAGITENSLDAVSDRDFAIDFAGACSVVMVHLSRLCEDLILYCSSEFGFVELSDAVSSGSSLMPQKKNPDALELIRGKAGRVFGHHTALLATMKGLPLAYNKDMQEDKEAVFDTADTTAICLKTAAIVMENAYLNSDRTRRAATRGYLNATELADYLVSKDVPFRTAHDVVGKVVLRAIDLNKELDQMDIEELRQFSDRIDEDVFEALSLTSTLSRKDRTGGTAPVRVAEALDNARAYLDTNS